MMVRMGSGQSTSPLYLYRLYGREAGEMKPFPRRGGRGKDGLRRRPSWGGFEEECTRTQISAVGSKTVLQGKKVERVTGYALSPNGDWRKELATYKNGLGGHYLRDLEEGKI